MPEEVMIKMLNCPACGVSLHLPKNFAGKVLCEYCGAEVPIVGIRQNREILAKQDINSGIPLQATEFELNTRIVNYLSSEEFIPLDIYEKAKVISEEHICIPAYLFACSGMANYKYEFGNERERQKITGSGQNTRVTTEKYTEWTHQSSIITDARDFVASGTSVDDGIVDHFYAALNPADLIDIEQMDFPADTDVREYNVPQAATFSKNIRPKMETILRDNALKQLNNQKYRNFSMGSINVTKESETRIFLGAYKVTYEYANVKHVLYFDAKADQMFGMDAIPIDPVRKQWVEDRLAEKKAIKPGTWPFTFGIIASSVVAFYALGLMLATGAIWAKVLLGILVAACIAGLVLSIINRSKKAKIYKAKQTEIQKKIDDFKAQKRKALADFRDKNGRKGRLKGIYEDC